MHRFVEELAHVQRAVSVIIETMSIVESRDGSWKEEGSRDDSKRSRFGRSALCMLCVPADARPRYTRARRLCGPQMPTSDGWVLVKCLYMEKQSIALSYISIKLDCTHQPSAEKRSPMRIQYPANSKKTIVEQSLLKHHEKKMKIG